LPNATEAGCAFGPCASCGHFDTCSDVWGSPSPQFDCVSCPDGYELDVVYEDCTGACVPEGFAVTPFSESACACGVERNASWGVPPGGATCAPSTAPSFTPTLAPTAWTGQTEATFHVSSYIALDDVWIDELR